MGRRLLICIAIAIIAVASFIAAYELGLQQQQDRAMTELNATSGTCSRVNESDNKAMLACLVNQSSIAGGYGFKLLKVSAGLTQILIYDTCTACLHVTALNNSGPYTDAWAKIVNVSIGQVFGAPCESTPASELLSTDVEEGSAVYETNASKQGVCI